MIRSAFLLCAAAVAATSFGCAPLVTPPPPPLVGLAVACTADSLLGKVSYLTIAFDPGPGKTAPGGVALPGGSTYAADLAAAFAAASPAFQQQLCALDRVYVNAATCTSTTECFGSSWGWRQSSNMLGQGRIVALSSGLWAYKTNQPPFPGQGPYSSYESDLMQSVMPLAGAHYANANVDTFAMTLLAALAHEVGHIRWYDLVAANGTDPASFCGGTFFQNAWNGRIRPPRWRTLLTAPERLRLWGNGPNWPNMHKRPPHVRDIDNLDNSPRRAQLIRDLFAAGQPWASAFAAVSPDEDFVETYKFKVLTTASTPLTSAKITVPGAPPDADIAADYANGIKPDLQTKVSCIPASL
jgi:hypothetical protein